MTTTQSSFRALFPASTFGDRPVVVLDGGMGTTLQAPPFSLGLDSALWSSELLATEEGLDQLRRLHQTWVDAGAEVLGSCTYQSSLPLFLPSQLSYDSSEISKALLTMNAALPAITQPFTPPSTHQPRTSPLAALSLGPFGAQLQPGQEYAGLYPPPFGPTSPSNFAYLPAAAETTPLPLSSVETTSDASEDALAAWHFSRLTQFAQSPAFDKISIIAFETVPVLRETRAIRRAMAAFNASRPEAAPKAFYISHVFPSDASGTPKFPDGGKEVEGAGPDVLAKEVVKATFGKLDGVRFETPGAVGINCSKPQKCGEIIAQLAAGLKELPTGTAKPWLVLYPDGGMTYDVVTRSWSSPDGLTDEKWGDIVAECAKGALESFEGVVAGGCCKAGPGAIAALRKSLVKEGLIHQ